MSPSDSVPKNICPVAHSETIFSRKTAAAGAIQSQRRPSRRAKWNSAHTAAANWPLSTPDRPR